ncbi:MAG: aminotransferase class III-fold pyridoxal phosphate-dependent enzyme, partial [Anaerolineales bacterium]|nr:aminotransferase class III-fold pyridoxal phosphate-dependent enzyme [Anaerolineales bacterium]
IETESKYTSGVYSKRPAAIVRGQGARLWDSDGKQYIDCVGGQGSANVGHSNLAVVHAIAEQAARLTVATEVFYNDQRALLEEKLAQIAPPQANVNRVFLCNSGAEANEGAIKFARYHTGRKEIVATMRGFHGRTFGALSATWEPKYREPFEPLVPGFKHIPYDNLEKAAQAIDENTAAVIIEIVQGEGGVRPGSKTFIEGIAKLAHERGALVILDEVQTGFGRTGKMFAAEHYDIAPDLISVAKSIAGGLPMGAILISERVRKLEPQIHGTTFGGNPLVCAAANATIDFLREHHLPERAAELGEYALGRLKRIESPLIRDVRGLGLMLGVELKIKVTPVLQALMERGVLAL